MQKQDEGHLPTVAAIQKPVEPAPVLEPEPEQDDERFFAQQVRESKMQKPVGTRVVVARPVRPVAQKTAAPAQAPRTTVPSVVPDITEPSVAPGTTAPLTGPSLTAKPAAPFFAQPEDGPLCLHWYSPRVELLKRPPLVMLTPEVYKRISLYIHVAKREVGWLGTVTRTQQGDFLIDQVYLLEQEVSDVETEMSEQGIARLGLELERKYGVRSIEHVNRMHFWGHSHVRMGTSPSERDENTSMRFGNTDGFSLLIRGIFNKRGRAEFVVYYFDKGIRVLDVPWGIYDTDTASILYLVEAEKAVVPTAKITAPSGERAQSVIQTLGLSLTGGGVQPGSAADSLVKKPMDAIASMFEFDKELSLETKMAGLPELLRPTEADLAEVLAEYKSKVTEHLVPGFTKLRKVFRALRSGKK